MQISIWVSLIVLHNQFRADNSLKLRYKLSHAPVIHHSAATVVEN